MSEKYEKFSGDMSRNEVEMDLSKFMDLIQENANLKSEVAELKASDLTNPWQKWIHLARAIDAWRIWPKSIFDCLHSISILFCNVVYGLRVTKH